MTITENAPQPDPSIIEHAGDSISDSLIRTLPGNAYSSPEIFAAEQEQIFEQMWFCAVRGSDLAEAGRLQDGPGRPGEHDRQPQPQGRARAFFNVCRHRGARLCSEETGQRQALVPMPVPRLDLRSRRQADRGAEPDQDARHRPATSTGCAASHVREWLGYVWVCLADEPPSFEDTVMGAVRSRLGDIEAIDHYDCRRHSRSAGGSSTTSRRTGSSSSRTSWSATTAPPSIRS